MAGWACRVAPPCGGDLEVDVVRNWHRGERRGTADGPGFAERFVAFAGGGVRGGGDRGSGVTCSVGWVGVIARVVVGKGPEVVVGSRGRVLNGFPRVLDCEEDGVDEVSAVSLRDGDDKPLN